MNKLEKELELQKTSNEYCILREKEICYDSCCDGFNAKCIWYESVAKQLKCNRRQKK